MDGSDDAEAAGPSVAKALDVGAGADVVAGTVADADGDSDAEADAEAAPGL